MFISLQVRNVLLFFFNATYRLFITILIIRRSYRIRERHLLSSTTLTTGTFIDIRTGHTVPSVNFQSIALLLLSYQIVDCVVLDDSQNIEAYVASTISYLYYSIRNQSEATILLRSEIIGKDGRKVTIKGKATVSSLLFRR